MTFSNTFCIFFNKATMEYTVLMTLLLAIYTEAAVPVFTTPGSSGRTVPVSESSPAGTSVYRAVAVDADGDILIYSLTSQVPASPQKFSIDSKSGVITTLSTFDFDGPDAISEYTISIRVTDGTSNIQTTLVMVIEDENDNSPVFRHYQVIRKKTKPGYVVADIMATDIDSSSNGRVTYKITGGNKEGAFGIDSENGVLYTMYELDSGDFYNLVIEARDYGATPRSSTMTMTLTLAGTLDSGTEKIRSNISSILIGYVLLLIISKSI